MFVNQKLSSTPARHYTPEFFVESYLPSEVSPFDHQLDEAVTEYTTKRGWIDAFDNVVGEPTIMRHQGRVYREDLVADSSGSISRHRQIVAGLSVAIFGDPLHSLPQIVDYLNANAMRVYLTEISTSLYTYLKANLRPELFVTSEYLDASHESGTMVDGVRHEDLSATSFEDGCFDVIITSEVLEHVPDAEKAEAEIVRIMKPGGIYIFTVPIDVNAPEDHILARLGQDGTIEFFGEPVYHGDPARAEGILAFRIFSVLGLKKRFEGLGCSFVCHRFWSKSYGIIGPDSWVLLARRPG